jgi:hypothetical protein
MKRQGTREQGNEGTGIREQGTEDRPREFGRLMREALPPVGEGAEPGRDLWPAMRQRLNKPVALRTVPWFDWVLAGGVAVFMLAFPAAVPILLYYL